MSLCSPALRRSLGPVAMVMAAFAAVPAVGQTTRPAEPYPPDEKYTLDQVGFIGEGYEYTIPSNRPNAGIFRDSRAVSLNGSGQVIGHSVRFNGNAVNLGQDAWIAEPGVEENSPAVTLQVGFVGPEYQYSLDGYELDNEDGIVRESRVDFLSDNGIAAGFTSRFATAFNQDEGLNDFGERPDEYFYLGQDAWRARTGVEAVVERVGLIDLPEYDFEVNLSIGTGSYRQGSGTGIFRESAITSQNSLGQAVGFTMRYTDIGSNLGSDAWYAAPTGVAQRIDLNVLNSAPGAAYQFTRTQGTTDSGLFRQSGATFINAAGQIMGYSTRWSSSGGSRGSDTWVTTVTPTGSTGTPQLVGLMGPGYEYTSRQASGGLYRNVAGFFLNDTGFIAGTSERFDGNSNLTDGNQARGYDAWMVTQATPRGTVAGTHRIGLIGPGYEYVPAGSTSAWRMSDVNFQNPLGDVVGTSFRYISKIQELGADAWLARPTELNASGEVRTYRISLAGDNYQWERFGVNTGFFRFGSAQAFHPEGFVAGFNMRFSPTGRDLGRDAWLAAPGDICV